MNQSLKNHIESIPKNPRLDLIQKIMDECKVERSTVSRWINGKAKLSYLVCLKLSEITKIPIEELYKE